MRKQRPVTHTSNEKGCHICTSHKTAAGLYPTVLRNKKRIKIVKILYEERNGPVPPGMLLRHTCDYPPCINLAHILLGTALDNINDMVTRNRNAKGEKNGLAKLTEAGVRLIRTSKRSTAQLAEHLKVTRGAIRHARCGKTWKHIDIAPLPATGPVLKIDDEAVVSILQSHERAEALGKKYNVAANTIRAIRIGTIRRTICPELPRQPSQQRLKLTKQQLHHIKNSGKSLQELALQYPLSRAQLSRIRAGKSRISQSQCALQGSRLTVVRTRQS